MPSLRARRLTPVLLLGGFSLTQAPVATAYGCGAPRQLSPSNGAVVPSDGAIWDVCYYAPYGFGVDPSGGCEPPLLKDDEENIVELVVDREIRSERYARVVTAHRPARALAAGARYHIEPTYFWQGERLHAFERQLCDRRRNVCRAVRGPGVVGPGGRLPSRATRRLVSTGARRGMSSRLREGCARAARRCGPWPRQVAVRRRE